MATDTMRRRMKQLTLPASFRIAALLACLLAPSIAAAQATVPVVVRVTELVQLNTNQDPVLGLLGDFYAEVTINGHSFSNFDDRCDNPGGGGFLFPYAFFTEDGTVVDPSCHGVPWTFTVDVPLTDLLFKPLGIEVRIRVKDADLVFDDTVETIDLKAVFGSRWHGDAVWPRNCNREAVLGSGARVCWQIEVGQDSDGDGLLDQWEIHGLDLDGDGVIDLDLPAMGANPMHKDLFVELDWRPGSPPQRAAIQQWKQAFAAAPIDAGGVANPDGLPGITLHVDTGGLTEAGLPVGDNLGGGNELPATFPVCTFDAFFPAKAANFDAAARGLAFRYGITSTQCCLAGSNAGQACNDDVQCPGSECTKSGGQGEIGGNDFVVWNTVFQGSTLMHELGHTLGLRHGGADSDNCKPNYLSVMNYDHFELQRLDGSAVIDFSPPRQTSGARGSAPLGPLAENDLDEPNILDPTDPQFFLVYTDGAASLKRYSLVGAPVDWNGDGDTLDLDVTANIDTSDAVTGRPVLCTNTEIRTAPNRLRGHDDWFNIALAFQQFGHSAAGPVNAVDTPEPTDREILQHRQTLNTTDLSITTSGPAGPYEAGVQLTLSYVLNVANKGPNPALPARVLDTVPPGAVVLAYAPTCVQNATGHLTCDLPGLLSGTAISTSLAVRTTAGCEGGLPKAIVNRATVENAARFAGPDPQPSDNASNFVTAVVDTTPPDLTLSATPSQLWPANHKFVPITITVTTGDVCDPTPAITLVSITSNEAADATGSGNTSPDVRGAAFGTDDRQFELRAERSGSGSGRVYTITYEARDRSGNVTTRRVTVTVPKGQGAP
jgi:hypothetical protein